MAFELLLSVFILGLFFSGGYELVPPALQLLALKVVLVSVGLLHAHAAGKLLVNTTVDWTDDFHPAHFVRMVLYVVVPICYSLGG
ncbi:MAG: hypothetical protein PHE73_03660 [Sulfurovaceae bacterium]|nr:hypothetical protein [Sulfurovaceae bacterium]